MMVQQFYYQFQIMVVIETLTGEKYDLTLSLQYEIDTGHCRHKELQSKVSVESSI